MRFRVTTVREAAGKHATHPCRIPRGRQSASKGLAFPRGMPYGRHGKGSCVKRLFSFAVLSFASPGCRCCCCCCCCCYCRCCCRASRLPLSTASSCVSGSPPAPVARAGGHPRRIPPKVAMSGQGPGASHGPVGQLSRIPCRQSESLGLAHPHRIPRAAANSGQGPGASRPHGRSVSPYPARCGKRRAWAVHDRAPP